MGSTAEDVAAAVADKKAHMYDMQLASSPTIPTAVALKKAQEMGLLQVLQAEAPSGKALAPEEVVARLPVAPTNPVEADMVDRMLRLLASHNIVRCQMEDKDGKYEPRYSAAPVGKWPTANEDCVSMAAPGISLVGGYSLRILVEPQGEKPAPGGSCKPAACVVADLESAFPAGTGDSGSADTRRPSAYNDLFKKAYADPKAFFTWWRAAREDVIAYPTSLPSAGDYGSADTSRPSVQVHYDNLFEKTTADGDAWEHSICDDPMIFCPAITTSDPEMGRSNQPTRDNGSSEEVGSTAGSDPLHVSLIVAVLGGVTAVMGLVAAVLGVWKSSSRRQV